MECAALSVQEIILRIAGKLNDSASMARDMQHALTLAPVDTTLQDHQIRSLQNLDRIEQIVDDCASLLRNLSEQLPDQTIDTQQARLSVRLHEVKNLLKPEQESDVSNPDGIQWL